MNGSPLVSVIIPTWQRHASLLNRCLPSVLGQDWKPAEIVIVSDGPDPDLHALVGDLDEPAWPGGFAVLTLPEHSPERHWGSAARLAGLREARGDYIAYLDDDDAYRPGHIATLATALCGNPGAMWAYSRMASHTPSGTAILGSTEPSFGTIGTPMIMHRRELLDIATWGEPAPGEDWNLVSSWIAAGAKYVALDEVTVDVWPSQFGQRP